MPRRDPRRREQLLAAAVRAIEAHGPGARMEDIAAEAGVTKPILYRHFRDKGGLYEAIAKEAASELMARLELAVEATRPSPRERIAQTIDAYLTALDERPHLYRFLLQSAAAERPEVSQTVGDFTHQLAERIAGIVEEEYARFGLAVTASPVIAHGMIGMVHQVGDWWLASGAVERDELVGMLTTLLWQGIPSLGTTPDAAD